MKKIISVLLVAFFACSAVAETQKTVGTESPQISTASLSQAIENVMIIHAHTDNPQQITIGIPMIVVAAAKGISNHHQSSTTTDVPQSVQTDH